MNLKEKSKQLPATPGVYLMKDSDSSVIYVGKAKKLKSRVSSYFQSSADYSPKVVKLINSIRDFDYITTDTEFEAFMLECRLIKEIKPYYNKKMKRPMSYIYISINISEKDPHIEIVPSDEKNIGSFYFGPFTSKNAVETGIEGLKKHCRILCGCKVKRNSPCINYPMGLCIGMCLGGNLWNDYIMVLERIINLLSGEDTSLLGEMESFMLEASERFDFETASVYRDYISAINYLVDKKKVVEFAKANQNIALIESLEKESFKFFLIKGNKVIFSQKYGLDNIDTGIIKKNLAEVILENFKACAENSIINIARDEIDEAQIIYSYLKNKSNECRYVVIPPEWISSDALNDIEKAVKTLLNK